MTTIPGQTVVIKQGQNNSGTVYPNQPYAATTVVNVSPMNNYNQQPYYNQQQSYNTTYPHSYNPPVYQN